MLKIVKTPEDLWHECTRLAMQPSVVNSELYETTNDHFVLAYGPVAQRNKYQALLYSAHNQFNASLVPIHDLGLFGEIPWPGQVVCHFHWIHGKTKIAKSNAEADEAVEYWRKLLQRIKENGHKIVWTVHNVMPHETVWVEQDKEIHQMVADAADALHVMATDSAALTKPFYVLDESKMFRVQHPVYTGTQPDQISQDEARSQLGIEKEEFVFLSFGAIIEYKGYDRLMAVYDQLRGRTRRKTRLIIAGAPTDTELAERVKVWAESKEDVILDVATVPNDKLQVYFRSADLAVCPYWQTMNSGVAMMALTFDLPILGPNSGGFLDVEKMGGGITFNSLNDADLLNKMASFVDEGLVDEYNFRKIKTNFNPDVISYDFFKNLSLVF